MIKHEKVSKYYHHDCLECLLSLFISLLTTRIVQNNHILAEIYFTFLKSYPRLKLKNFQYQIWTSVKKIGKVVIKLDNFQFLLNNISSNFKLKLC